MICARNCSCLLCRELQSCTPKSKKMKKSDAKIPDNGNFILRKAEAFKPSGALGFIRGAARLSVRHWQNKDRPVTHATQPPRVSRAASCEQLFPIKVSADGPSSKIFRAPSCEQLPKSRGGESKPMFRIITESKFVGKSQNSDMYTGREQPKGMNKMKRRDDSTYSKNTHEKYIPLPPYEPKYNGHTYTELKPKFIDGEGKTKVQPLYQEVKKKVSKDKSGQPASVKVSQSKKQTTDLAACFEELSKKAASDTDRYKSSSNSELRPRSSNLNKVPAENARQNDHKVVIYFGDSMLRNQVPIEPPAMPVKVMDRNKEDIYAKKLLEETGNLGITKSQKMSGTAELVSQISIDNEPIYSEITYGDQNRVEDVERSVTVEDLIEGKLCHDDNNNMIATRSEDGVINVKFRDNFECARKWVDIINGNALPDDGPPDMAAESLDWSFVQGWRKR